MPDKDKKNKSISKIKTARTAATISKWVGKGVGVIGALMKNIPGNFTELAGTALEFASEVTEAKLSDKIADNENIETIQDDKENIKQS